MHTLAVYNLKGGVSKTTTAVNLAYLAARDGRRTLVWDLDPQGAASFYFRVKPRVKGGGEKLVRGKTDLDDPIRGTDFDGLDLLPADFSYRNLDLVFDQLKKSKKRLARLIRPLKDDYDLLVFDCPPGVSLVSENVFHAADALLVPIIPTTLSLRALDQIRAFLKEAAPKRLRVLPFFTMVDRRKRLHRDVVEAHAGRGGFLEPVVPFASAVERMGVRRAPLPSYDARSAAAGAYAALWAAVRDRLDDAD